MRIKRTGAALVIGFLSVAAMAGCGQASTPKPAASTPAASVAACTAALEKIGVTAIAADAGGTFPAAVNQACDGLPAAAMNSAVNTAMGKLTGAAP